MSDLIDRQAAIELIENESRKWGDEYEISDVLCDLSDMPPAQPEIMKEYNLKKIYNIYVKIAQSHFVYQPSIPKTITAMPFDWLETQNLLEKYLEEHGADFDALCREYVSDNVKDDCSSAQQWIPKENCPMRHKNGNCLPVGGFCTANRDICDALHQAYERGKMDAESQWIPTSVRPPKDFDRVYIQTKWGEHEICKYIPKKIKSEEYPDGFWGEADCPEYDYFEVVAWHELPETWEGGKDETD